MRVKDILQRDPTLNQLANNGQARLHARNELRGELETFVCEGQYADGIQKIIGSFLGDLSKTSQRGAWVSGFFGSGKSHLLKMLANLWQDTVVDGATARNLVPAIPEELQALLRELDTAGKRAGGLLAAAGALPSGTMDSVRLTVLAVLLRAVGLPEQYPQARFCLWLHSLGKFDEVRAAVESSGKPFERELNNLYVSGLLARAVMDSENHFAASETEAKQLLKAQFPPQNSDITTDDFLRVAKDALRLAGRDGRLPCTLLILDEVQQYIGASTDRSVLVTEVAEAVSKQLDSHVMIVGAGQSALTDVPLLQKLMDRFTIRVPLSDADVEAVTRKVLLQKKPSAVTEVRSVMDRHGGEISRQLQGTPIGERIEDHDIMVDDYPLLPVRRRFWENCFRQIDAAGTSSQLRSQLRIIYDALAKISERPLGTLIPGDELFDALAPEMLNTGVLLREINEHISRVAHTDGELARRVCGLVFLIGKLRRETGADIGVRANKDHLADLLVDDLSADNGKLRSEVEEKLKSLSDAGVLLLVGDEYRLQTREGSEWDREFRNRQTRLGNDDAAVEFKRDQLLYTQIDKAIRSVRLVQGAAKEPRQFLVHRDQTPPAADGAGIPIWVRDGWSCAEKDVLNAARAAGIESPILFVFIPLQSAEDLRRLIIEAEAAEQTLNVKGIPSTSEGQEAKQSMESRDARAVDGRERLVQDIVANAKVFQGGGGEVLLTSLEDRLRVAAEASLVRLFPRFKEADSAAWETALKRAREGADHPFQPIGHSDATERHAVCQEVRATIGNGKSGSEIRKKLGAAPFGWPRDAVDAALIALHRLQHISATLNGRAVPAGQLDQSKVPKAEFRLENVALSVSDRIAIRKLFLELGVSCNAGEELARAGPFLAELISLARSAGGESPLPARPSVTEIEDVACLSGNEQLAAIRQKGPEWEAQIRAWTKARDLIDQLKVTWGLVERLAKYAATLPEASSDLQQIAAIRDQRLLLGSGDQVNAIRISLATLLRGAIQARQMLLEEAFRAATASLATNGLWLKLAPADQDSIKAAVGLMTLANPNISTDDALADTLERKPLTAMQDELDAIAGRVNQAIERGARLLEPKIQTVTLERSTLRNSEDVEAWTLRQKEVLLEAVRVGPVLVN